MSHAVRAMVLVLAAVLLPAPATAVQRPTPATRAPAPDSLRAFLLTLGPGAAVWERFGHNALWIHDPEAGTDIAYHYGLFDMAEEGFLLNFLRGRMFYSMGSADALAMVEAYRRYGRDAFIQELRLTTSEIRGLERFLVWNLQPENRVYRYDYFRDNCSTRIRDALDDVLGGTLRDTLSAHPSPVTYRAQAVALTAEDRLLTTGMDLGLGPLADQPISRWELAFIPMRLRDDLHRISVRRDDRTVSLVASSRHLPAIGRSDEDMSAPAPLDPPPGRTLWMLGVGALWGLVLAGAGWVAGRDVGDIRTVARTVLGMGGTLWALLSGTLGLVVLGLWTLTDHEFAWRNENLLQADPLALALVVLVPIAVTRGSSTATRTAGIVAGLSVAGFALHFLPLTGQANLPIIALALPVHAGLFLGLRQLGRGLPGGSRPSD